MPRVKIDYIVSFSSEDPDNPASNLLAWDVNKKKWLCTKGETSCSVVLQLAKAVKICSVNIGVYQSALVEVLVGRSETPNEPFQVLVPCSTFQSVSEARRAAPGDADKVRSFGAETLAAARARRWDRLRLVCSQPYNKHCQFGLSFVHVFCDEDSAPAPAPTPAPAPAPARLTVALDLHSSDDEEFSPGELFAKHLQKPKDSSDTGAQIRQASSHALKNIPDSSIKLTKTPIARPSCSARRDRPNDDVERPTNDSVRPTDDCDRPTDRRRDDLLYTPEDNRPNHKIDRVVNTHNQQKRDDEINKHKDKHNSSHKYDRTADKYETKTKTTNEPSNKGEGQSKRDRDKGGSSKQKDDEYSSNRSKNDGSSGHGRKDDRVSGHIKKDDRASVHVRKDDGPSGNGQRGDESRKRPRSDKKRENKTEPALVAGPVSAAPHELLADVVFVLSGYEHPRRGRLRDAALALGATARADWAPDCTHLICAFPNTPKLRAARSAGGGARAVAVRGEWLEECARTRRRLPWQWFATEPHRLVPPPPGWDRPDDASAGHHSESDTDDEIERVRQKTKRRAPPSPPARTSPGRASPSPRREADVSAGSDVMFVRDERLQGSVTVVESDSCGGSTDEEGAAPRAVRAARARLPALFAGRCFAVRAAAPRAPRLQRYLRAYGGLVLQEAESKVDYVVCEPEWRGAAGGAGGGGECVRAAWLWRCHRERRLVDPKEYALAPAHSH